MAQGEWTHHHVGVFFLTFLAYAALHAVRKTLSNVKITLSEEWTPCDAGLVSAAGVRAPASGVQLDVMNVSSKSEGFTSVQYTRETRSIMNAIVKSKAVASSEIFFYCPRGNGAWSEESVERQIFLPDNEEAEKFLGVLDSSFLFVYGIGLYVSGFVGDRCDPRLLLTCGLVLTSVVTFLFGPVLEWTSTYYQPLYVLLMIASGLAQSLVWPCAVAVMASWFGRGSRGLVMGLWSSCQSVGNVVGALIVSVVLEYGYEYAFFVNSSLTFASAVFIFCGLISTPHELGLPSADEEDYESCRLTKMCSTNSSTKDNNPMDKYLTEKNSFTGTNNLDSLGENREDPQRGSFPTTASQQQKKAKEDFCLISISEIADRSSMSAESDKLVSYHDTEGKIGQNRSSKATSENRKRRTVSPSKITLLADHGQKTSKWRAAERLDSNQLGDPSKPLQQAEEIGFLAALLLPGVIPYSLALALLKMVHYAFFSWLPFYLTAALAWREVDADKLSIWYDVGAIFGGVAAGLLSDRLQLRAAVHAPMLLLGLVLLHLYGAGLAGHQLTGNAVLLAALGLFVGGVAVIICGAVAADLGRRESDSGVSEALSTVTGIVDGSGTLGAALGQVAIPFLQVAHGWRAVFYLLELAILLATLILLPSVAAEVGPLLLAPGPGSRRPGLEKGGEREASPDGGLAEAHRGYTELENDGGDGGGACGKATGIFHRLCDWGGSLCEKMAARSGLHRVGDRRSGYNSFSDKVTQ